MSKKESFTPRESFHETVSTQESEQEANTSIDSSEAVFLKIHLYPTLDTRQITTIHVPSHLKFKEVFDQLCLKYKYNPKEYSLKLLEGMIDAPMDQTLQDVGATECCLVKKEKVGVIGETLLSAKPHTQANFSDFKGVSTVLKVLLYIKYRNILSWSKAS